MYSNLKTYLILFGGVFALSTSAIFVKIADAPSAVTAFYRLFIAGAVLLPAFLCSKTSRTEFRTLTKHSHPDQTSMDADPFRRPLPCPALCALV